MRFVLGTAGHVDHGKTTLVRALTGVDTDRLPEEKRRGITIELGFARWDLAPGVQASVVDVPGHRRLVHAMIAGAQGMQAVLFVVAADEGVMPQTREHAEVCALVGVKHAVVAVTKCDRADADLAAAAALEARELLEGRVRVTDIVPCSAVTGEGLDALRSAVGVMLRALPPPPLARHARVGVDRVFSVKGAGTVVTGTLVRGRLVTGQPLWIVGASGKRAAHARGLEAHGEKLGAIDAPARVAINLGGVAREEVERGDVVTDDPDLDAPGMVDVVLRGEATGVKRSVRATLHVGTARSGARVDRTRVAQGGKVVRLRLESPIAMAGGDAFVLRGTDVGARAGAVLGGGVVLDARPPKRPSAALVDALVAGDAVAAATELVAFRAPRPVEVGDVRARFAVDAGAIEAALERGVKEKTLVKLEGAWVHRRALEELATVAQSLVVEHAERAPLDRGLPLETLRAKLAERAGLAVASEAVRLAATKRSPSDVEAIVIEGDVARVAAQGQLDDASASSLAKAREVVEASGLHGTGEHAVKEATGARDVRPLLARLVRDGAAVRVGELWIARAVVDAMRALAVERLRAASRLSVIDFKQASGLARKQAVLLLELFDREGLTRRDGDVRVLARAAGGA